MQPLSQANATAFSFRFSVYYLMPADAENFSSGLGAALNAAAARFGGNASLRYSYSAYAGGSHFTGFAHVPNGTFSDVSFAAALQVWGAPVLSSGGVFASRIMVNHMWLMFQEQISIVLGSSSVEFVNGSDCSDAARGAAVVLTSVAVPADGSCVTLAAPIVKGYYTVASLSLALAPIVGPSVAQSRYGIVADGSTALFTCPLPATPLPASLQGAATRTYENGTIDGVSFSSLYGITTYSSRSGGYSYTWCPTSVSTLPSGATLITVEPTPGFLGKRYTSCFLITPRRHDTFSLAGLPIPSDIHDTSDSGSSNLCALAAAFYEANPAQSDPIMNISFDAAAHPLMQCAGNNGGQLYGYTNASILGASSRAVCKNSHSSICAFHERSDFNGAHYSFTGFDVRYGHTYVIPASGMVYRMCSVFGSTGVAFLDENLRRAVNGTNNGTNITYEHKCEQYYRNLRVQRNLHISGCFRARARARQCQAVGLRSLGRHRWIGDPEYPHAGLPFQFQQRALRPPSQTHPFQPPPRRRVQHPPSSPSP